MKIDYPVRAGYDLPSQVDFSKQNKQMQPTDTPKNFQYQEILDSLIAPCPPEDFEERETVAYRWVFDTLDDAMNFVPQNVRYPDRFKFREEKVKCRAMGLSFFNSEENARKRYDELKNRMPAKKVGAAFGENIAGGILKKEMGVQGEANKEGHFDFFPYEGIEMKTNFSIIAAL